MGSEQPATCTRGPKIDIELQDALGRGHQYNPQLPWYANEPLGAWPTLAQLGVSLLCRLRCGTIQLDFQMPLRFNLRYNKGDISEVPDKADMAESRSLVQLRGTDSKRHSTRTPANF
eukprot:4961695-Amphidinium_carterae.1